MKQIKKSSLKKKGIKVKIKPLDKAWYALSYGKDFLEIATITSDSKALFDFLFEAVEGIYEHLEKQEEK